MKLSELYLSNGGLAKSFTKRPKNRYIKSDSSGGTKEYPSRIGITNAPLKPRYRTYFNAPLTGSQTKSGYIKHGKVSMRGQFRKRGDNSNIGPLGP